MILVDTHIVGWLAFDQGRLSKNARTAINRARQEGEGLAISDITLLELTTLSQKGCIRLDVSLESFLHEVEARFIVLPSAAVHACASWDYRQRIPGIQLTVLLEPLPWWKACFYSPQTARSGDRAWFAQSGENRSRAWPGNARLLS
jgi:PIN domain nuclease of toxin-antitoxin system